MTVPPWIEIQRAVGGALRLACGDRSGLSFFDTTVDGFWRSFRAAAICFPLNLLLLGFSTPVTQIDVYGGLSIVTIETISYVIHWVAFPLIVLPICDLFGRGDRFTAFMVVFNWSQIPQYTLLAVIGLDGATGLLPPAILQWVMQAAIFAVLVYEWYIGRVTLGITGAQATLIVMVDWVFAIGLDRFTHGLY